MWSRHCSDKNQRTTMGRKQITVNIITCICVFTVFIVSGNTIDNGVKGEPILECAADSISVTFMTEKEFEGHVYVKGHYDNSLCRTDATLKKSVNFTVPFSLCDVRRRRSSNPRGIYVCVTVIITFHPMFITKIDKSYHVKCFYMETDRTVTTRLDVSLNSEQQRKIVVMIGGDNHRVKALINRNNSFDDFESDTFSNGVITQRIALPSCRYQVLMDGPHGSPVKYTTVGKQVYHQWSCAEEDGTVPETNLYCSTVHSCVAKEENGKEVQLLDDNGCAVDKYLLNDLVYISDLTAGQMSQVFKFADQSSLYFHCQIRLSLKLGSCKRTSDNCSVEQVRNKRELFITSHNSDADVTVVDVFSQFMTVFDIDDPINADSLQRFETKELKHKTICLKPTSFCFLLTIFITELLISTLSVIIFYRKTCRKQEYCTE